MPRSLEFDREETLTKIMELFWRKGYKATSIKDIVEHTDLRPGSIYNSFGNKKSLFMAVISHYEKHRTSQMIKILYGSGSPLENIRRFFNNIIETPEERKSIGCLLSNTAVELAPHDSEIARSTGNAMQKIENAFVDCLNRAVEVRELPKETDTKSLATYLATCTHGLLVTGKTMPDKERIKNIVEIIMTTINSNK